MKEFDGRRLDHKTREQIRMRAVQQIEAGESPEVIAKGLGFHRSCVYEWVAKYREGGLDALRTKPIAGRPRKLTGKHLAEAVRHHYLEESIAVEVSVRAVDTVDDSRVDTR